MENSLKSLFASTFIHSVVVSLKSIDGAKTLGGLNYLLSLSFKMCGCNKKSLLQSEIKRSYYVI